MCFYKASGKTAEPSKTDINILRDPAILSVGSGLASSAEKQNASTTEMSIVNLFIFLA